MKAPLHPSGVKKRTRSRMQTFAVAATAAWSRARAPRNAPPVLCLLALGLTLTSSGCTVHEPAAGESSGVQVGFRVRSDAAERLNSDDGWAGAFNENVTVQADRPFRIRFEVEGSRHATIARRFVLQYRRNGGAWSEVAAEDFPKPDEASPRVSIVSTGAYTHGSATTDLLPGSSALFRVGAGISLSPWTPSWSGNAGHGEWEWPLVIRRFADGAVMNNEGDTFEFRMVDANGSLLSSYTNPVLTLSVPHGHVGGTFVETPGRIGPWEASNGDLYFIVEPSETDNKMMVVKSADRGATWQEVDAPNRPSENDLEGVGSALYGNTIYILHQRSRRTLLHSFRTSDHPTHPDTWEVRDELVAIHEPPPTQVAAIAVRSDGSIVSVYGGASKIHYRIRTPGGNWGTEAMIDAGVPPATLSGPRVALGADDMVHLAYTGDGGIAWYRRIRPDGTLTPRTQITSGLDASASGRGSILPLLYLPRTNSVAIIYRLETGKLWERRVIGDAALSAPVQVSDRSVVQNAVDSHQTGADAVADGTAVHVLFIEQGSGSIYYTRADATGVWQPSTLQVDGIRGSWIRGALLTRGDGPTYGYVYDGGSRGGAGMNKFAQVRLGGR